MFRHGAGHRLVLCQHRQLGYTSTKNDEISHEIISGHLHRGVTLLNATGAYSGERHDVIMCVIKRPQISELKRLVKGIDEHAFVVVTDAKNVFGNGFESISEVK